VLHSQSRVPRATATFYRKPFDHLTEGCPSDIAKFVVAVQTLVPAFVGVFVAPVVRAGVLGSPSRCDLCYRTSSAVAMAPSND